MIPVLTTIALIVIGVLLFELIIFIHEFGHFITAKKSGVLVNEFALGMGPKLFSFTKGETVYSLRAFPIGGYCAMEGEDEDSENPRAFNNAKVWKRMIIIVAGAFMNIVLGLVLMFVVVVQAPSYGSNVISAFPQNSFSANTGLKAGDRIVKLNGYGIDTTQDLSFAVATSECKEVSGSLTGIYKQDCAIELCRLYGDLTSDKKNPLTKKQDAKILGIVTEGCGKIQAADTKSSAKPVYEQYYARVNDALNIKNYKIPEIKSKKTRQRYTADAEVIRDGKSVTLTDVQFYTYITSDEPDKPKVSFDFYVEPIEKNVGTVLSQTGKQTVSMMRVVWSSLIGLIQGKFSFEDLSGPVGVASAVTQVASEGLESGFGDAVNNIIYMMALITINLGIFNMLPFPALDGGRFVFLLIEGIFRKPIPRKAEKIVNGVGLGILLLFMLLITFKDLWKLIPF